MDDLNAPRTYRHARTGLIGVYDRRVALEDPNLIEVDVDAKPLAFTPIPSEAVADYLASHEEKSGEGNVTRRDAKTARRDSAGKR
ncbi:MULTISPECIES: hypothetical protein [unclassified Microbacterium]|uniref:hypothetical protein n=1 Tax=unclassified Microbacterium TaxID=2609290 RepID=UPI000EA8BBF8|nr:MULTISPECIES: hypothetical protein [unclassified Microbacterium]MBT2484860.1 hypothetical protein [Microbacterium sp. ISL-108]RKN67730.1 hypothetical protein D7252_09085 [Microbacterium sp. CGR2]